MTIEELRSQLRDLANCKHGYDPEADHGKADDLLLEFINDKEVTEAFNDIDKWYA